jgi:hypothetical protein
VDGSLVAELSDNGVLVAVTSQRFGQPPFGYNNWHLCFAIAKPSFQAGRNAYLVALGLAALARERSAAI